MPDGPRRRPKAIPARPRCSACRSTAVRIEHVVRGATVEYVLECRKCGWSSQRSAGRR